MKDFYPKLVDAFRFGGNLYGIRKNGLLSFSITTRICLIRKALPPTANWTWDDFLAAAQKSPRTTKSA
jgi:ABC-type glycerol-3-phosphate transport system substrate-binding protein